MRQIIVFLLFLSFFGLFSPKTTFSQTREVEEFTCDEFVTKSLEEAAIVAELFDIVDRRNVEHTREAWRIIRTMISDNVLRDLPDECDDLKDLWTDWLASRGNIFKAHTEASVVSRALIERLIELGYLPPQDEDSDT